MRWKKLKRVIISLLIIKIIIFIIFIAKSDLITFSKEMNYSNNYQQGTESDSIVRKRQRLISIVRNEEERGIIIKLRGKKNARPLLDNKRDPYKPIVE